MILSYHAPSSLTEALDYLRENGDVQIIAGGTDLLVQHYEKLDRLTGLLDLGKVAELKQITTGPQVWIGALVTHQEILDHPWLRAHVPILCQGAGEVAAPQIRNRGTLGGNLANASPAADMAPPLVVLEARVELAGPGAKSVPVQEFFTGPGGTVLAPGQIITGVSFPVPPANAGGCYIKLGRRKAMAIATASVAVQVEVADAKLKDIRICLGSVAPRPVRAGQTEALLRGQSLDALDLDQALAQLRAEISPIDDIRSTAEYRRQVAGVIFRRALFQAIKNAGTGWIVRNYPYSKRQGALPFRWMPNCAWWTSCATTAPPGHQGRMRQGRVRFLHGADGRQISRLLPGPGGSGRRRRHRHRRGPGRRGCSPSPSGCLHSPWRSPVRLLHAGHAHERQVPSGH